ncbi:prokaryotic phospholipase A2-domain-containing protein [Plectosphaerella plurivora]|uniref:Prokaryotic phospholipase A2-domain-containing protein n=1 Tax=Plectosphaerella plurivora TaxID=936078 RepID=A0A9P8VG98_9PEZI|nr:prokaryotic phospholipase A2-domain-containing protein [Plectosphaerella plurivora]
MKFASVVAFAAGALALPASDLPKRQSVTAVTDNLSFTVTLPTFTARRNARNPATLDWTSDGCTTSPDNPFGYPFVPACHRHDFGYHNFRAQSRFTTSNKLRIDQKFLADLNFQCDGVTIKGPCRALADVYYAAVRAFGGGDATPGRLAADSELLKIYEEKVAIYDAAVKEAQDKGELPILH